VSKKESKVQRKEVVVGNVRQKPLLQFTKFGLSATQISLILTDIVLLPCIEEIETVNM